MNETLLTTPQASAYLEAKGYYRSPKTLERDRWLGSGPRYLKGPGGRIRYKQIELDRWIAQNTTEAA